MAEAAKRRVVTIPEVPGYYGTVLYIASDPEGYGEMRLEGHFPDTVWDGRLGQRVLIVPLDPEPTDG